MTKILRFPLLFILVYFASVSFVSAQGNINNQLIGKWVVADFSYKSATHPDQDYTLSRKDFENMVKFKRSLTISTNRRIEEQYGDMHIDYVYQLDGNKIFYWIPSSQDGRTVLDEAVRNSTKTAIFSVSFDRGNMVWTKQNSAFILKLILKKQ